MPDLLIELFSEEIPARMQAKAASDLKRIVTDGLVEAGLTYEAAGAFSTPRRLVLSVEGLTAESRPVREERKGPRADAPAAALEGFLRSTGLTREQLELRDDKKAQVYFAVIEKPGRAAAEIVAGVLEGAVRNFPWPKSMRWGTGSLRWVRPLQSIICLLVDEGGAAVVDLDIDGIRAADTTEGHRFMGNGRFAVTSFDDYRAELWKARVMLDAAEREAHIWQGATNLAFAAGMEVVEDRGLLAEVAGLVEWPVPLMGRIGEDFLSLPAEVLQTSMKEHQKFFSVRNPKTGRIEGFVTVANVETADDGATILKGNQKVLSARLSDARFFWENDLRVAKAGMGEWLDGLGAVTFHNKLGSQAERIARIAALAREIAPLVGAAPDVAEAAARVAKADLRSAMVGEFPELQGLMGMYYARAAGMDEAVANAARDHYAPLGPTDAVPVEPVSVAVALADKIDTLTGFWAIDEKPTGSKDPFALRRAALGVIRLVLVNGVRGGLKATFTGHILGNEKLRASLFADRAESLEAWWNISRVGKKAGEKYLEGLVASVVASNEDDLIQRVRLIERMPSDLLAFFHDRLKVFLKDQGIRHDVIDACLAMPGNDDLTLLVKRAQALQGFMASADGPDLLQGFKRANNILAQAEAKDGVEYSFGADPKFAEGDEEKALFNALDVAEQAIGPAVKAEDFAGAMAAMAQLRAPIDAFFTAVQVNSDNQIVRRNRLNLLHRIRAVCGGVADLGRVEG
ncbi:glycine--tRNA ligase subunit beta [Gemmobacter aquarius]|uniref:Glycine--tRNA ligase beta subunit n=1 Tax=Paragemmobacter aquarius TaxID=2169400 RepID=A0A2S0UMI6_9RHOB|nr:glycine--tRNA ligase subunit beta [Gemmobacter aquarius]AWB49027.1 glycine--tRNA ligase subunit beta [Gemmobacter aquarius]